MDVFSDFFSISLNLILSIFRLVGDNLIIFVPTFAIFWYAVFSVVKYLAFRRPI